MRRHLIDEYIELTTNHGISIQKGNNVFSNKIHSEIQKTVSIIENSEIEIKTEFYKLMEHSNPSVRCWTAIELIETNKKKSLSTLKKVSKEKGVIGLTAKTLIDMWNKGMIKKNDWKNAST